MTRKTRKNAQLKLDFKRWGGARKGAGRKLTPGRRRSARHVTRPALKRRHPVHVTMRLAGGLPNLRRRRAFRVVQQALAKACVRFDARITDWAVMSNHLHLIVEAGSARALSRAMQGFTIRVARGLNRVWRRKGKVFGSRYHARALTTPLEVRRALNYVLNNARRHAAQGGHTYADHWLDPFSSAPAFEAWKNRPPPTEDDIAHTPRGAPRTWLRRVGWRRHGYLRVAETPRPWSRG